MTDLQPICDWNINTSYGTFAQSMLGRVPLILNPESEQSPEDQLEPYWNRFDETTDWQLTHDCVLFSRSYEPRQPAAQTILGNRVILVYPSSIVVVLDDKGTFIAGQMT